MFVHVHFGVAMTSLRLCELSGVTGALLGLGAAGQGWAFLYFLKIGRLPEAEGYMRFGILKS